MVEGASIQPGLAILSEVGADLTKFATAKLIAPWMGLCPDNRGTGRRPHATRARKVDANDFRVIPET